MAKLLITVPDLPLPHYGLPTDNGFCVSIGRAESAGICIPIPSVSSHHCDLLRVPGGYEIRDAGSTNGLRVGDALKKVVRLTPEQPVFLGEARLEIVLSDEDKELFAQEAKNSEEAQTNKVSDDGDKVDPVVPPAPVPPTVEEAETKAESKEDEEEPFVQRPVNFPLPVPGHLEYGQLHYKEEDDKPAIARPSLNGGKSKAEESQVVPLVLYGVLMFLLSVGAGLTFQHYRVTGELLPLEMAGISSPKQNLKDQLEKKQAEHGIASETDKSENADQTKDSESSSDQGQEADDDSDF